MSHMVLMVANARPTPVTRLVLWFVIYMTGRYFAGCETQTLQTKTIPQPRVTMREDHTHISTLLEAIYTMIFYRFSFLTFSLNLSDVSCTLPSMAVIFSM